MRELKQVRDQAKGLRKIMTFAESRLWALLRDRRLEPLKFRRQVPIGPYIPDFVCFSPRLIVEADGRVQDWRDPERVARREACFLEQRFRILRFSNDQIVDQPNYVLFAIREATGTVGATPHPVAYATTFSHRGSRHSYLP